MSVALIPESAPFTTEQRAWLNGFFAGMMGMSQTTPSVDVSALAQGLMSAAPAEEESFPWHDPALPMEDRLTLAEGKPFERRLMAAMAQLDCGACGYECQTYAEKIANGEEKSLSKCAPGGQDTARTLKLLLRDRGSIDPVLPASKPEQPKGYTRERPFEATLLKAENLNKIGSAKHTTHVELDLSGSGLIHSVGDSLGVYPTNCPDLVSDVLAALHAQGDEPVVTTEGIEIDLRGALTIHCCLRTVTDELMELLSRSATNGDGVGIVELQNDLDRLAKLDVLDVLHLFPKLRPRFGDLVRSLNPMAPRLYSISSSLKAYPDQVHLTIGRVVTDVVGRPRKGVASTMFADRLPMGSKVRVFVQQSHGFSVPADPNAPLLMVGPGTGIAPFRAFLQERQATGAKGKNWLFFGDQRQEYDYLYEHELTEYLRTGVLTRLDTAFSRDQAQKVYVQDRLREHGVDVYRWLEEGASFCVCGDAKRMAGDVDKALHEIIEKQGKKSLEQAREYVTAMKKAKRYLRDVY